MNKRWSRGLGAWWSGGLVVWTSDFLLFSLAAAQSDCWSKFYKEIIFCKKNYGVSFLLSEKISVKGKNISPLYNYLTSKKANHEFGGKISWNFNKFIIDKDGQVIARFGSSTKPSSKKLIKVLEKSL